MPRPVALHHGIFGFDELRFGPVRIPQFPGVVKALTENGYRAVVARVHPVASISRRAAELKLSIERLLGPVGGGCGSGYEGDGRIILVAHSLGGLDARYMIRHLGMSDRVAALITIASPHRGASLADFWQTHLNGRLKVYDTLERMGLDVGAARDLTRPSMVTFNQQTPDHPAVGYYSVTCSKSRTEIRARLVPTHRIVEREEGENDGIVSVASALWGTHLAHWPIDHIAAVNRPSFRDRSAGAGDVAQKYVELVERVTNELDAGERTCFSGATEIAPAG